MDWRSSANPHASLFSSNPDERISGRWSTAGRLWKLEDEEAVRLEALEMVADLREEIAILPVRTGAGWRVIVRDEKRLRLF